MHVNFMSLGMFINLQRMFIHLCMYSIILNGRGNGDVSPNIYLIINCKEPLNVCGFFFNYSSSFFIYESIQYTLAYSNE